MSYMMFSMGTMNPSHVEAGSSMVKAKLAGLGSSRVSTTISITGVTTGASVVASTWDSVDAGIAGRAGLYADQEMAAVMQAGGWTPLNFAIGEITSERGNGEGAYTVAVFGQADRPAFDRTDEMADLLWGIASKNGVNGLRGLRMVAAGEQTGAIMNIFYTDSVDAYLATSSELASNSDFMSLMSDQEARIVDRAINRTI